MINIAILGCGKIFYKHLSALHRNKKFRLISICDIDQAKLDSIKIPGLKKYKNIETMISKEKKIRYDIYFNT